MNRRLFLVLLSIFLICGVACAAGYHAVTSVEAGKMLAKRGNVFLLDVRTPEEFRQARIKGAVLIPVSEIERRVAEVPKSRTIIVYCAVGSRSHQAAKFLASRGFDVFDMSDGIVGWHRNGFPIER